MRRETVRHRALTLAMSILIGAPVAGARADAECVGDCNGTMTVTISNVLTMVNIALGNLPVSSCTNGDGDGNGRITINEVLTAVNSALNGCGVAMPTPTASPLPTATPTPTPTDLGVTPTPLVGTVARRAAGTTINTIQLLRAVSAAMSAFTQLGGAGDGQQADAVAAEATPTPKPCPGGGSTTTVCAQMLLGVGPRNYTLTFNNCMLSNAAGGTTSLIGSLTAQATGLGTCNTPPTSLSTFAFKNVSVTQRDAHGTTTLSASLNVTGSATATLSASACILSGLDATLRGVMSLTSADIGLIANFDHTDIGLSFDQFSAGCVPTAYRTSVDGAVTYSGASAGASYHATFTDFVFSDDSTSGNDMVRIDGMLDSTCVGTQLNFSTSSPLVITGETSCPTQGAISVTAGNVTDGLGYIAGGITIDLGLDDSVDETFTSCLDPRLYVCPAS